MHPPYVHPEPSDARVVVEASLLVDVDALVVASWRTVLGDFLASRRWAGPVDLTGTDAAMVMGVGDVDAAAALLEARRVVLPFGEPGTDDPGTLLGIAARWRREMARSTERQGVATHPWAHDLLTRLRASGTRHAVVSAAMDPAPLLAQAGLGELVGVVVGPEGAGVVDVDPVPQVVLRTALDRLGARADDVRLLAASPVLVEAGRHLGLGAVEGVRSEAIAPDVLLASGAEEVVRPWSIAAAAGDVGSRRG